MALVSHLYCLKILSNAQPLAHLNSLIRPPQTPPFVHSNPSFCPPQPPYSSTRNPTFCPPQPPYSSTPTPTFFHPNPHFATFIPFFVNPHPSQHHQTLYTRTLFFLLWRSHFSVGPPTGVGGLGPTIGAGGGLDMFGQKKPGMASLGAAAQQAFQQAGNKPSKQSTSKAVFKSMLCKPTHTWHSWHSTTSWQ